MGKKYWKRYAGAFFVLLLTCCFFTASVKFVQAEENTTVYYGDTNQDGYISSKDALIILKHSVELELIQEARILKLADIDKNSEIDARDALQVLKTAVGFLDPVPYIEDEEAVVPPEPAGGKTLIVYFSWSSNTERMANTIKEQTGGDLLELVPVNPYPTDYTECTEVALEERDEDARPAIRNLPVSIKEYDKILIGYPIWWHTAPMIIGTFLEHYDLTGVDVYPFTQSASMNREQFENSMEFVRRCANGATVHDGLFVRASDISGITAYLIENGLAAASSI